MNQLQRILDSLPATAPELAALEQTTTPAIYAALSTLCRNGKAKKTDRKGGVITGRRGAKPSFYKRT